MRHRSLQQRLFALTLVCVGLTLSATAAVAAPNYTRVILRKTAAAGQCSTSQTVVANGGFIARSDFGSRYECGIDTVAIPIEDISSATVYVRLSGSHNPMNEPKVAPMARLCFRSVVTSVQTCGATAYGSKALKSTQRIQVAAPSGVFDDEHLAYLWVSVPRMPRGYGHFYGYHLSKFVYTPSALTP